LSALPSGALSETDPPIRCAQRHRSARNLEAAAHKPNRKIFDPDIEPLYILPVIDLNLIRGFVTIYETGSVSAAAERLHVSQPSISYTLKRLRDLLGEPLFRRTRDGMAPTYFATQLYEKFRIAISEVEGAIESTRKFDPSRSSRRFRLAMSDLGEITFLPHLMELVQKIAPDLGFDIVAVDVTKLEEWLNAGKIDAAICNRGVPVDSAGEVIFTDHYVCLASNRHPRLSSKLTMKQYLAERHVVVDPSTGHSVVEERLQELGCTRKIALRVPHFSVLPEVIATTDLLLVLPSGAARRFAAQHPVRAFDLPFKVRKLETMLRWHEHSGDIAALRWLCRTVRECAAAWDRPERAEFPTV
jgi:DNA-binding transcriptional LysR family regulator